MGRRAATADDATAERFLANGWAALRERLGYGENADASSALGDIPLLAGIGPTLAVGEDTTGAFYRRWPNREAYLSDLLDYALAQTRLGGTDDERTRRMLESLADRPPISRLIALVAAAELDDLAQDPWLALQLCLWPDSRRQEQVREHLQNSYESTSDTWQFAYDMVVNMYRLSLRPDVSTRRLAVLLTALVDGMAIRKVLDPDSVDDDLMPEGVQAMVLGILDPTLDTSGMTVADALDALSSNDD